MTPSCPSSKRRSLGRWRRSTRVPWCEDRTVKDSGTGGEGLGRTLAVPLPRVLEDTANSGADLGELRAAGG